MTFDDFDFMKDIEKRGLGEIQNFHHRDDGKKMWSAMEEYVSDFIDSYYKSDKDIKEDYELQDFVKEVSDNGFVRLRQMNSPKKIQHKDELKSLLVKIIFTTTAKHSSFNFFEYQRFIPNAPYAIEVGDSLSNIVYNVFVRVHFRQS